MPGVVVDGMDVLAVREAVSQAVARARKGEGPSLVECKTYRWYGHSRSDPRVYRTREEEKEWREKDPITRLSKRLMEDGVATQEEVDAVLARAKEAIEKATEFALATPGGSGPSASCAKRSPRLRICARSLIGRPSSRPSAKR